MPWLRAGAPSLHPRLWLVSILLQLVERLASGRPANVTNGPRSASATTWARITASMPTTPTSCAPGPPHPAEVPGLQKLGAQIPLLQTHPSPQNPKALASGAIPVPQDQLKEPQDHPALQHSQDLLSLP